jgi:hypothetical protein
MEPLVNLPKYVSFRDRLIELIKKEDYGVVYKSLEDKNSSNLYIQGFHPDDTMEVSCG